MRSEYPVPRVTLNLQESSESTLISSNLQILTAYMYMSCCARTTPSNMMECRGANAPGTALGFVLINLRAQKVNQGSRVGGWAHELSRRSRTIDSNDNRLLHDTAKAGHRA